MKGIILAAGKGSRLYPMTRPVCKPLLPVYDKPMIYYPLAALLQAGIRDILIIIPPGEEGPFYRLLGSGGRFGVNITYEVQEVARGIADALLIGCGLGRSDEVTEVVCTMLREAACPIVLDADGIFALAQGVQALVGLEEDLLRGVLGQRPILQNDIAQAQNVVAVGLHQLGEPFILLCARNRGVLHVVHLLIY